MLHDLTLALQADRVLVMAKADGCMADGAPDDLACTGAGRGVLVSLRIFAGRDPQARPRRRWVALLRF